MQERLRQEIDYLLIYYPQLQHTDSGIWILIPTYPIPDGWNSGTIDVAFKVQDGFPGGKPYGFFTPADITFKGKPPNNFQPNTSNQPPFDGKWGFFSWSPAGPWIPKEDIKSGSNLVNWVHSFRQRFEDGL